MHYAQLVTLHWTAYHALKVLRRKVTEWNYFLLHSCHIPVYAETLAKRSLFTSVNLLDISKYAYMSFNTNIERWKFVAVIITTKIVNIKYSGCFKPKYSITSSTAWREKWGLTALSFFSSGISVIWILKWGIGVSFSPAVCGISSFWLTVFGKRRSFTVLRYCSLCSPV